MPGEEKPARPTLPEITTVGNLLALLRRGALSGIVQVGGTSKNVATRNWKAFLKLRERAKGQLTPEVLERWIRQVLNAEDSNVSYARVLSQDLREFSDALDGAVKPAVSDHKPLTEDHQKAFDLICERGPLTGKEVVNRLGLSSESLFTSHYVPELKRHGIKNRRGLGYYHPDYYKPGPAPRGKR